MSGENNLQTTNVNIEDEIASLFNITELLEMGVHFGGRHGEPKMKKQYVYCKTNNLNIFNLEITEVKLREALKKIYDVISEGKSILLLCTKKNSSSQLLKDMAESCGQYYINNRWMPGTLSNKETVKKSLERIEMLKVTLTKSNKINKSKKNEVTELHKKELKFEGIKNCNLDNIGAVVSIFCDNLGIVAHECHLTGTPLIAVCDSDTKDHVLEKVNYVISGNDDGIKSIYLYLRLITTVARKGLENLYSKIKKIKENKDESSTMAQLLKNEELKNMTTKKIENINENHKN